MLSPTQARTSLSSIDDVTENFFTRLENYLSTENPNNIESIRAILNTVLEAIQPLRIEMWKLKEIGKESEASFKLIAYMQLYQRCTAVLFFMDSTKKPPLYNENDFLHGIMELRNSILKPKLHNRIKEEVT